MDSKQLDEIIKHGYAFYDSTKDVENHRYKSWEYCHEIFKELRGRNDEETVDYLCLHLAWYLASWGMLRGKAFLLQKDYKVHKPVVNLICQPEWDDLWDIKAEDLANKETAEKIFSLSNQIFDIYKDATGRDASPTLLTKILLGTIGCTPAYDRYFTAGLGKINVTKTYGVNSLRKVANLYLDNIEEFEKLRNFCKEQSGIDYPPVKILDMCFFESGMEEE